MPRLRSTLWINIRVRRGRIMTDWIRDRHPLLAAAFCAALQFGITALVLVLGKMLFPPEQFGKVKLAAFASTLLVPIILATVFGMWRQLGLQRVRITPLFGASLLICAPFLLHGLTVPQETTVAGALSIQAVNAVAEELLFRGVIFALLSRLPLAKALIINAVIFGSMHLLHGVMDGNWGAAAYESVVTMFGGLVFAAVRAETGSLWPPIVLHMLVNLSEIFSSSEAARAPGALNVDDLASRVLQFAVFCWVVWKCRGSPASTSRSAPRSTETAL